MLVDLLSISSGSSLSVGPGVKWGERECWREGNRRKVERGYTHTEVIVAPTLCGLPDHI